MSKKLTVKKELYNWLRCKSLQELINEDGEYSEKEMTSFAEHYHEIKSKFKDLEIKKYKLESEMWQSDYEKSQARIKELEDVTLAKEQRQKLFNHMSEQHDISLLESEMDEIVRIIKTK